MSLAALDHGFTVPPMFSNEMYSSINAFADVKPEA
jgi:hypothetical protein